MCRTLCVLLVVFTATLALDSESGDNQLPAGILKALRNEYSAMTHTKPKQRPTLAETAQVKETASARAASGEKALSAERLRVEAMWIEKCSVCPAKCPKGLSCGKCKIAKGNEWAVDPGFRSCRVCAAGQFSAEGAASCTKCPVGKASARGSSVCDHCPPGDYADKEGTAACKQCPKGKHSNKADTKCSSCYNGAEAPVPGMAKCTCPAGTYGKTGTVGCVKCEAGKYATQAGQSERDCLSCPKGKASAKEGAKSKLDCQDCDRGEP